VLSATSSVTILVPTLNRSDFVVRLLDYYRDTGFAGRILIGDSSSHDHFEVVRGKIEEIGRRLDMLQVACVGLDTSATLARLNTMVETPYVTYSGDDDYIVPTGIAACAAFLDSHPDYVAAQGQGRAFALDGPGANGRMRFTGPYPLRGFERESAAARLAWHLLDYTVTIFAVHRTAVWRDMWSRLDRVPDQAFSAELLPACLSVVYGKLKLLRVLYLLRQAHPGTYHLDHVLDWFASPAWAPSYRVFLDTVATEISRIDGTSKSEAESLVRAVFHEYLFANRSSLGYWGRRLRMNIATRITPVYLAVEQSLPAPVVPAARALAISIFAAPFTMIGHLAGTPLQLLQWLAQRKAGLADRLTSESSRARRAAEKSASASEAHPHA
jgi:glycosyltransferase domain-containing protein